MLLAFISDFKTISIFTERSHIMALPSATNKIWSDIICGTKVINFEFLAVKIFIGTAQRNYKNNPESLQKSAQELFQLFDKNQNLPTVQKDLAKLG